MEAVTRRRLFLGTSAAVAAVVVLVAHEVMLPFVLASVIAYVLTPLVGRLERRRVPRAIAILLVYGVVLGSMGGFFRLISPRIALEFRTLSAELPQLAADARDHWAPAIANRLRDVGISPPAPSPEAPPPASTSAFVARTQPDGSLAIDVGTGVVVTETTRGWLVEPAPENRKESFDPNAAIADAQRESPVSVHRRV